MVLSSRVNRISCSIQAAHVHPRAIEKGLLSVVRPSRATRLLNSDQFTKRMNAQVFGQELLVEGSSVMESLSVKKENIRLTLAFLRSLDKLKS